MALSEIGCAAAKPAAKPYKLADAHGLYLLVNPGGSKLWRWKYRFGGKEKLLAIGAWPVIKLAAARDARDDAKASLRRGIDPNLERRIAKTLSAAQRLQSFEALAREWHERQKPSWGERHAQDVIESLAKDVFPTLGELHVNAITPPLVLATLRAVEARGAIETAHRLRQRMSAVFVYALACGIGQSDPAAIIKGALSAMRHGRHQPALTS